MNIFLTIVLIAVSLSMDAFSLALIYGTYSLSKKNCFLLSIIVGIFHFFMPLFGVLLGNFITSYILLNINLVVGVIFGIIGIEMIISSIRDDNINIIISVLGFLLFGFSVSIDSFTTGIGLSLISNNYLLCFIKGIQIAFSLIYIESQNYKNQLNKRIFSWNTSTNTFIPVSSVPRNSRPAQ